jgi:transcription elongation factor Elf1
MGKLTTPDWILKGKKNPAEKKKKGKTYKVKKCPECGSTDVSIVLVGEEGKRPDNWECKSCKWKGRNIEGEELTEDEFLEHLEKMEGK